MKRLPIAFALCLGLVACGAKPATFQVETDGTPLSASLSLCGKETAMHRADKIFATDRRVDCSGEGDVKLKLKGGAQLNCHIGTVTPGVAMRWKFYAQGDACGLDAIELKK